MNMCCIGCPGRASCNCSCHRRHTLTEQLDELAGARQLAVATYCDDRSTEEQRAAARQLMLDIRRERRQLRAAAIHAARCSCACHLTPVVKEGHVCAPEGGQL